MAAPMISLTAWALHAVMQDEYVLYPFMQLTSYLGPNAIFQPALAGNDWVRSEGSVD